MTIALQFESMTNVAFKTQRQTILESSRGGGSAALEEPAVVSNRTSLDIPSEDRFAAASSRIQEMEMLPQ